MNLGILLWNTCNAKCVHCAVHSGPTERAQMTDEQILRAIDAAFVDDPSPRIGLSGGEAFVFPDRLLRIVEYVTARGGRVSINTNGFWGVTKSMALTRLRPFADAQVTKLVVSVDAYHQEFIDVRRPLNVVQAAIELQLECEIQFVAVKGGYRLADFMKEHGDSLLNINCREIACHPVGRAETMVDPASLFVKPGLPTGRCPSSVLSISADGRVIPCCNTAGHLPALHLACVDDDLVDVNDRFRHDPLFYVMWREGPRALVPLAEAVGFSARPQGYIDQCHLCHDLFKRTEVANAIREGIGPVARSAMVSDFEEQIQAAFSPGGPRSSPTCRAGSPSG